MRLANSLDRNTTADQVSERAGDALASACLFGIVGGLVFALAIVPTIPAVALGAVIGAAIGIVVAYQ